MKLKLKEDPKEWRKVTILSAIPVAILITLLCWWRHKMPLVIWAALMAVLCGIILSAWFRPHWFRGYYRWSSRVGFWLSQSIGQVVLALLFLIVITPLGLTLRLLGKDWLKLKSPGDAATYWNKTKESGPLDRMF